MSTKDAIKRNFSRYAAYYDAYSSVQDRVGLRLISNAGTEEFEHILDIGCGTGNYTRLLRDKYCCAMIMAVDIARPMIKIAQHKLANENIEFAAADAETAALDENFDLITSNACFQWFNNPDKALVRYKNALREGGTILFSMFGPLTFRELRQALEELYKKEVAISSDAFINADRISWILEKSFMQVSIDDEIFKETYSSLWELLSTIKYTGTQGAGLNGRGFSKGRLTELEKIYKERFKDITATYQVFYCRGRRRD